MKYAIKSIDRLRYNNLKLNEMIDHLEFIHERLCLEYENNDSKVLETIILQTIQTAQLIRQITYYNQ
jgi:hypothetical protein